MRPVVVLLLGAGCVAGDPVEYPVESPCGSTDATIRGTVRGVGALSAHLFDATGEEIAAVDADEDGAYEFVVAPGDYVVAGAAYDPKTGSGYVPPDTCWSDDAVLSLEACDDVVADLDAGSCDTADKPNLYLYPAKDTRTTVTLHHGPRQEVFASDPPYAGGWTGTAHPDGWFTPTGGEKAPFLFYEITLLPAQLRSLPLTDAVCIPGDGAVDAMADLLGEYGFTERERADFVDGWRDDLPLRPSYAVYPQRSVDQVVRVDIQPPLPLERLWLVVTDGAGCVPSSAKPAPMLRNGPHAVEWGVVLKGLR